MTTLNISTDKKVDIIYKYLFDNNKAIEEEFFWNNLNEKEIKKIEKIKSEKKSNFDTLKKSVLGK